MEDQYDTWIEYWERDDFWKDSPLWKENAELFFRRANKIIKFSKNDSVLNIGCGSGYLEELIAPSVRKIHAVDTAEQFVKLCRKNCANHFNVTFSLQGSNYTDLKDLGASFSLILCVSVVQYFRDIAEIEALITSARDVALPGARMLIADLPLNRGFLGFSWDVLCSCLQSVRGGYWRDLLRTGFALLLQRTSYRSFRAETSELRFDMPIIESLVQRMGLNARIIQENLSVYSNRPSLLIHL